MLAAAPTISLSSDIIMSGAAWMETRVEDVEFKHIQVGQKSYSQVQANAADRT